jgi:hypothetical protein
MAACCAGAIATIDAAHAAPVVVSGTGANIASVTPARDQYRTNLGGGTTAGANGSFGGVRREINWDGVPQQFDAPNAFPANFFNVNSPRGVILSTPGSGFQNSGATTDAGAGQPAAANFGNIDATYTNQFAPFTPQRLFTQLGSTITDVNFFVPGTSNPATVTGFGVMFSDVDLANTTSVQFFDQDNASLGTFFAPASQGNQTFSFLGVSFNAGELVSRVRITNGNLALGAGVHENPNATEFPSDQVTMDDFIYSEPLGVPEPGSTALIGMAGLLSVGRRRRER